MATRRDRRAARAKPSPAALSRDLAASRDRILGLEDRLSGAYEKVFRQAAKIAARRFREKATAHAVTAAAQPPWTPPNADEIVDVPAIVSQLHTKADPIRRSAIREYGAALDGIANWDVTNPLAAGVLAGAGQHVTAIAETTRVNVMRTISASYEQGLSIPETAKAIQAGMQAASGARARLIARTELAAVANGGSLAATQIFADATGDTLYKRWLTAPGAKEPRHEDYEGLDEQTVSLDDTFDVGGFALQFPGDPDGPPEEVCNCRCALIYVSDPAEIITPSSVPADSTELDPSIGDLTSLPDLIDPEKAAEETWLAAAEANGLPREIAARVHASQLVPRSMILNDRWETSVTELARKRPPPQPEYVLHYKPRETAGIETIPAPFGADKGILDYYDPAVAEVKPHAFKEGVLDVYPKPDSGYLTYEQIADKIPEWRTPSDEFLYRGVSAEEMANVIATGEIRSYGAYNLGPGQVGRTYFGTRASTAASYASSYAPLSMKPTFDRPAFILKVRRPTGLDLDTHIEGEVGVPGAFPAKEIVDVIEVRPYDIQNGTIELRPDSPYDPGSPYIGAGGDGGGRQGVVFKELGPLPTAPKRAEDILAGRLSAPAELTSAVPTAEAGIDAAASPEMGAVLGDRANATQSALRSGGLDAQLTNELKKVDTAIGGGVLDRGAVTLRGVSDMRPMFGSWPPKIGDVAYDPAYASTTTDARVAARFAGTGHDAGYVTYHSAPGQNGLWVPGIRVQGKDELLLPRGLPLRVIGVGERGGLPDVHVEIVGRGVTPGLADYGELAQVELEPLTGASPYSFAGPILRNAARSEAEVTAALTDIVARQGGTFEGLPFRVKSAPSVARKIEKTMRKKGVPLQAAATGIKDGLRYTAIFEPDQYVPKMNAVLDELKAKAGIVPERITATWEPGAEYAGTNVVMRAPNGLRFELQFHTPESFNVKEHVNHGFYQQQRRLEEGSPEWKALADKMLKNANAVERPPGVLEWKYQASVEADIGITPFRAGTDDPFGFYDRARFKTFEAHAEKIASSYGVTIDAKLKVPSVWEGVQEPGVSIHAHDGEKGVAAFAADLGKVYDQQGVLLFSPTLGDDIIATFDAFPPDVGRDWVLGAMERAGLPGGRFLEDGRLQIIGSGPAFVSQLDAVARDLGGVGYDSALGRFSLLQKADGDYEAALRDFASAEGQQVRAPGAAVEEHGGTPPLGPGTPGGQGAAPKVVTGFGPAPLPHIPHWSLAEVKKMTDDELWGALAINGKIENIARADVTGVESRRLRAEVWRRADDDRRFMAGVAPGPDLVLRYTDVAGDNQLHTTFSDGHGTIREMALAAIKRGQTEMVVSDHGHLMTDADVARQHRQIDKLNEEFAGKFKILKGVETNIDENGYLDVAPDALAKFDTVNAAIHGTEAVGPQQILFPHTPTERLLNALNTPRLAVLVHPHAVTADWDAVAKKAAEKNVALEVNGRSLLRQDSGDQAALMIAAAKRNGAKLAFGSDAHNAGDIADLAYAVRFAAENGVTEQDIVGFQRVGGSLVADPSTTLPGDREITLGKIGSARLGGGMNVVWKVERDGEYLTVKPKPDPQLLANLGIDSENPLRENIAPGLDLERERAAYVFSRYFNEAGGDEFHVNVPPYRISNIIQPNALNHAESPAGIYPFVPGEVGRDSYSWAAEIADSGLQDEGRDAGLYDALIANSDRHAGNFIFGDDGHLWLIDHGNAFPESLGFESDDNALLQSDAVEVFGTDLDASEVAFLERLRDRWPQIEADLAEAGILAASTSEMKARLDFMIETASRLPPYLDDRGW